MSLPGVLVLLVIVAAFGVLGAPQQGPQDWGMKGGPR